MADIQAALASAGERLAAGDYAAAEAACRRALEADPRRPDSLHMLGVILTVAGRAPEAEAPLRAAIQRSPAWPDAHCQLGRVYLLLERHDDAGKSFRRALRLNPDHLDSLLGLGDTLIKSDNPAEAVDVYRRLVAIAPHRADARTQLARALQGAGDPDGAMAVAKAAVSALAGAAEPLYGMGMLHRAQGRLDEAEAAFVEALGLDPMHRQAAQGLANVRHDRALLALRDGDFEAGWRDFEWRRNLAAYARVSGGFTGAMWTGDAPAGRTIRVHCDQGLGDAIQFARYVPLLAARDARVRLVCHPPLLGLFKSLPGVDFLATTEDPTPEAHVAVPLMSLPGLFRTRLDTIPADVPYLHPAPEAVADWKKRFAAIPGRKVGVVWAGNPEFKGDSRRSMAAAAMAPLTGIEGVTCVSLQFGHRAGDGGALAGPRFVDPLDKKVDFAETAAAVAALDLVIAVDTAVAHLAGALARPVWILLPHASDWRWLTERTDSPWYPTARLFRQNSGEEWPPVIERVAAALRGS